MTSRTGLWFVLVASAAVFLILLSQRGYLAPLQDVGLRALSPFGRALTALAEGIRGLGEGDPEERIAELEAENTRLRVRLAELQEAEEHARELAQLLAITEENPQRQLLAASVVERESSNLQELVAVNRGSSDGVREGMVALSPEGALVGSVIRVFPSFAWIRLLTDAASSVNAEVQKADIRGVVVGHPGGRVTMELVSLTAVLRPGDTVVTSGLGGSYPPGLLIGEVAGIERSGQELFAEVEVRPSADLASLDSVLVLLSFTPLPLEGP